MIISKTSRRRAARAEVAGATALSMVGVGLLASAPFAVGHIATASNSTSVVLGKIVKATGSGATVDASSGQESVSFGTATQFRMTKRTVAGSVATGACVEVEVTADKSGAALVARGVTLVGGVPAKNVGACSTQVVDGDGLGLAFSASPMFAQVSLSLSYGDVTSKSATMLGLNGWTSPLASLLPAKATVTAISAHAVAVEVTSTTDWNETLVVTTSALKVGQCHLAVGTPGPGGVTAARDADVGPSSPGPKPCPPRQFLTGVP